MFLSCLLLAQDEKAVHKTTEELEAEVEALKAEIAVVRMEYGYAIQACTMPDLMQGRLALKAAQQKELQAKQKSAAQRKKANEEKH